VGRTSSDTPKNAQFNIRLTHEQIESLRAIEFIDRITGAELIRLLLDAEFERRKNDPLFLQALRLQREAKLRDEGRLAVLPYADGAS
jgi:hypothetical protein